jgi:predicted DNA binding CopG/RHH family protein
MINKDKETVRVCVRINKTLYRRIKGLLGYRGITFQSWCDEVLTERLETEESDK